MKSNVKEEAARALFPLLSAFHEVNGCLLESVWRNSKYDCVHTIAINFPHKSLIIQVSEDDDTLDFWIVNSSDTENHAKVDLSAFEPWARMIGQPFGWGWVMLNQQGYLDGVMLAFGGVIPEIAVLAVASALKVRLIS